MPLSLEDRRNLVDLLVKGFSTSSYTARSVLLSGIDIQFDRNEGSVRGDFELIVYKLDALGSDAGLRILIANTLPYVGGTEISKALTALLEALDRGPVRPHVDINELKRPSAPFFSRDRLQTIYAAAHKAGLHSSRPAVLGGIDKDFVGDLLTNPAPGQQLKMDLDALNERDELENGSLPIRTWLENALSMKGHLKEARVFREALAELPRGK